MLRADVLREGALGMITHAARDGVRDLEAKLRPFVARRVRSSADVDDILQDVFLRMQRGLSGLRDEERFGPWVYQVARSAIVDYQRASNKHRVVDAPAEEEPTPPSDDGRDAERDLAAYIAPFVAMLPSPYREALTLTELQGLTQKEAADMIGISLSGMKSRVQRGRQQLRRSLEECCHIALDARGRVVACEPRADGRLPTSATERVAGLPPFCAEGCAQEPEPLEPRASFWRRADVSDEHAWSLRLTAEERADLARIVHELHDRPLASLAASDLPRDGAFVAHVARVREALRDGLGFVRVRGLDTTGLSAEEIERTFVVAGLGLGSLVPQNQRGELLTHVRDTGANPDLPSTRLYTTRAEQDFHTDGADVIGLLCLAGARSGGESRIVSSGAIVNEIRRVRPDLYRVLLEDFPWHYQEAGQEALWFSRPICTLPSRSAAGARLNTFFIPWYIRRSQELPGAPRLDDRQREAIALVESLANDPKLFLDMTFEPGDVQWLKNAAILHKRTAYEDFDEPERRRHLLRLWLAAPDFDDGDAALRRGVVSEERR